VTADGKAEIAIRETHRGQSAVAWRNDLDEVPEAELKARFDESYAANVMPGERLKSLAFENREQPEAPLVIAYALEVESLGHRVGAELRIPPLLASSLQASFARRDARTTAALIAPGAHSTIRVTVEAPEGGKLSTVPEAMKSSFGKASFELAVESKGPRTLEITRRLHLPLMRVKPEEYGAFAQFCRGVDLAEASELGVALP
jgi:hypothetical protein